MVLSEIGEPAAHGHGVAAVELFERLDDQQGLGNVTLNLGVTAALRGNGDEAARLFARSGEHYRRSGDVIGRGGVLNNQAELLTLQGRWSDAAQALAEAERIYTAAAYPMGIGVTLSGRSRVLLMVGQSSEARSELARARDVFVQIGSASLLYDTLVREIELEVFVGAFDSALERGEEAERVAARLHEPALLEPTRARLRAWSLAGAGKGEDAISSMSHALAAARAQGAHFEIAFSLEGLSLLDGVSARERAGCKREFAQLVDRLGIVQSPGSPLAP
jgi:hypothetical protein